MNKIDEDFDEKFYLKKYPEVAEYMHDSGWPIRKRLFHHYLNYGKDNFKNVREYKDSILGPNFAVDEDFDEKFYLEKYPESSEYLKDFDLDIREKLFHHYLNYGKDNFKNVKEYKDSILGPNFTVDEDFDEKFYLEKYPESSEYLGDFDLDLREKLFHHYLIQGKNNFKNAREYKDSILGSDFIVDEDFDEKFYLEKYPESSEYLKDFDLDPKEKLFHHYLTQGKDQRSKNIKEYSEKVFGVELVVDPDFDEFFYSKEYPDSNNFFQPFCKENKIEEKLRLFFHYVTCGKVLDYSINEKEKIKKDIQIEKERIEKERILRGRDEINLEDIDKYI